MDEKRYVSGQTTVQIAHDLPAPRLLITPHSYTTTDQTKVLLRLYPAVPAKLAVTYGSIRMDHREQDTVQAEVIKFEGSDRAQPKYPGGFNFSIQVLGNIAFDRDGNQVSPSFAYDPDTGDVVASEAFYGGVQVSYTTQFWVLDYRALIESIGDPIDPGYRTTYGMVLAYYQGAVATYDIQPPDQNKDSQYRELYRVYSKVVLDPDGAWEYPPDPWPTEKRQYPYSNINKEGPDTENNHEDERPHEVGFVDKFGQIDYRTYWALIEQPYTGSANYKPKLFLRTTQGQKPPKGFEDAFAGIDWATLKADLERRYGTLATS